LHRPYFIRGFETGFYHLLRFGGVLWFQRGRSLKKADNKGRKMGGRGLQVEKQ
jgi:hypothetical protein